MCIWPSVRVRLLVPLAPVAPRAGLRYSVATPQKERFG